MPNATIKTIAQEAGVSIATVSKALNDMPDISEAVKQRIREIARRQGYVINTAARQLAMGYAFSVGVIVPDIGRYGTAQTYRALCERLVGGGYSVYLNDSGGDKRKEAVLATHMLERRVGAIIVIPATTDMSHIESAVGGQVPVIYVGGAVNPSAPAAVFCDELKGGRLAARHLYHAGHRSCAVYTCGRAATEQHERARGFIEYMQRHGCRVSLSTAGDRLYGETAGRWLAQQAIERGEVPGAVFATDDMLALGAMAVFMQGGLAVPQRVSVVGYEDSPSASLALLQLTSVATPQREMGICAGDMAIDLIKRSPDVVRTIHLEPQLVRRATVAAVPAKEAAMV